MIEIVQSIKDLPALRAAWDELTPPVPMLLHEWVSAAAESFHASDELCVVVIRDSNNRVTSIAPLVRTGSSFAPVLENIGAPYLFEPSGLLYRDADSLRELVRVVLKRGIPLQLDRILIEKDPLSAVASACAQRALYVEREGSTSPFSRLSDWETFEQGISSKRRSDLRRAMRHAQKFGDVEFEILSPTPETHGAAFAELLDIEHQSWKKGSGTAISIDKRYESFFGKFTELASARELIRIGFMRIGGKAVAFNLAVQFGGAMWVLKIGYREEFSKCSPGVLLMHEMVKCGCAANLDRFEFLGTEESWLQLWSPEVRKYSNIRAFPLNLTGACQYGRAASGFLVGKVRRLLHTACRAESSRND